MLILVLGGAASGKSLLAERYCTRLGKERLYIATMRPEGAEARARIHKHQIQRRELGFQTLECYGSLAGITLPSGVDVALLECMGNLVANTMFSCNLPTECILEETISAISGILKNLRHLVVVSNMVFGGTECYQGQMEEYLGCLGTLNRRLADWADVVVEAVCGLPLVLKGEELIS